MGNELQFTASQNKTHGLPIAVSNVMKTLKNLVLAQIMILLTLLSFAESSFSQELRRQTFLNPKIIAVDGLVKVAFFDADSTLRVSLSGSVSANTVDDVMVLPWVEIKIAQLIQHGFLIAVVSNQGGIKAGAVTHEIADGALFKAIELIKAKNPKANIHYFDYAETSDEFRKPGRGMADRLEAKLNDMKLKIDWGKSFMVGDSAYKKGVDQNPKTGLPGNHFSNADRLFAENLKITFIEPTDFFGWRKFGIDVFETATQVTEFLKTNPQPLRELNYPL